MPTDEVVVSTSASSVPTLAVRSMCGPFDIRSPPVKKHMVAGHLVPTFKRFLLSKRRRVWIEILSPDDSLEESNRIMNPATERLADNERVVIKVMRQAKSDNDGSSGSDEDASLATMEESIATAGGGAHFWKVHRQYRSEDVKVLHTHGKSVEVQLGHGGEVVVRDFKFESDRQATQFEATIQKLQELEKERAHRHIRAYKEKKALGKTKKTGMAETPRGVSTVVEDESETLMDGDVNLLIEIVSARNLPIADIVSTDAYVIARMKGQEMHRTSFISNSLDPIWTLDTGSLFLLSMTPEAFFGSDGLTFLVKDFDALGANETLGDVNVTLDELLSSTGERTEYKIVPASAAFKPKKGESSLFLRVKPATQADVEFMEAYKGSAKKFGVYADETFLPIRKVSSKALRRQEKKGADKETLIRVKPCPDPGRPEQQTKWMTEQQISQEALKPSTHWIQAGSGDVGKIYIELIGCDGLPNMDKTTVNFLDRTDAFACIAYEDCVVNSDVIGDCLSPRWMPWSQRAFCLSMSHPSSDVLVGIFDHDPEKSPMQLVSSAIGNVHDAIGRLVINVSKFKPGTTYLLNYPLYYGELKEHRAESQGTVTIRIRLEFPDIRKAMIKAMVPPQQAVVSVARQIDYDVAKFTTDGAVDDQKFSLNTLTRYIEELESYDIILDKVSEAVMTVWLWRGHYDAEVCGRAMKLPLHSLTAFCWGVAVTWNYNLLPAFWLFCIGWILLACNEMMRQHPSHWHQVPSYHEFFHRLLLSRAPTETIPPTTDLKKIEDYERQVESLAARRLDEKKKTAEHEEALQLELGAEMAQAAEAEDHEGKNGGVLGGISVNPLKPILHPIQKQLHDIVSMLRIAKSVVLWHEAYYSFWLVTVCFAAAIVALFIPWGFLLRWTLRIVVFVALGPWMALVDRHYFKTNPNMTDEERDEAFKNKLKARYEEVVASATHLHIRKERAVKMQSMKNYMFGKFHLKVPLFCEDLFDDLPLPSSSCEPADPNVHIEIEEFKYGQNLTGDMIPQREVQMARSSKLKKTKSRPKILRKLTLGRHKKDAEKIPLLESAGTDGYDGIEKGGKTE